MNLLARKFQEANPDAPDPLDDDIALADLRLAAEDVKRSLTQRDSVTQFVMSGSVRANVEVTRQEFEDATRDLLQETVDFTRSTVEQAAELGAPTIDRVLLVGGSSFMPQVSRALTDAFPGWAPELEDPNQAVAKGAALFGLQAELRGMIEERAVEASNNGELDPELKAQIHREVAAEKGMAVAAVGTIAETTVTNVCSRGFGVKVVREGRLGESDADFFVDHLIAPQTPLPVDPPREATYGTMVPSQPQVRLVLMQQAGGALSDDVQDNEFLKEGYFDLPGDDPAGTPIHVTMAMANNGILTVTASHPRVTEPLVFRADGATAVLSEEAIAQSALRVQALNRT